MIIIADDFGYSQKANGLIIRASRAKAIQGASTMVNGKASQPALEYIKANPKQIQFGLHLNLTEGKPLGDAKTVRSLVDKNGNFYPWPKLFARALLGLVKPDHVKRETKAQIERLQTVVKPIPFLNSHHHIHLLPFFLKIIAPVATQYGINRIRGCRKIHWRSIFLGQKTKALAIQFFGTLTVNYQVSILNYFVDLDWAGADAASRAKFFKNLPDDTELACHPFAADRGDQIKANENSTLAWLVVNVINRNNRATDASAGQRVLAKL